jgi:hypothetical protein
MPPLVAFSKTANKSSTLFHALPFLAAGLQVDGLGGKESHKPVDDNELTVSKTPPTPTTSVSLIGPRPIQ